MLTFGERPERGVMPGLHCGEGRVPPGALGPDEEISWWYAGWAGRIRAALLLSLVADPRRSWGRWVESGERPGRGNADFRERRRRDVPGAWVLRLGLPGM